MKKRPMITGSVGCACWLMCCAAIFGSMPVNGEVSGAKQDYIVAAYVWPSCHDEPMSREALW
ncbi:MAG TPA: hypothetical protein PKW66_28570, partial [Polyangiaceae bacterium]|nr:hypothetical protein [Polyangiaceae bacterium]